MEPSPFKQAIQEHLKLQDRNRPLEAVMPLARYRSTESEADVARMDSPPHEEGQADWPLAEADLDLFVTDEMWVRTPSFEWGD
jgi:hypothetical protein